MRRRLSILFFILAVFCFLGGSGECEILPKYLGYWAVDGGSISKLLPCNKIESFAQYQGVSKEKIKAVFSSKTRFYFYSGNVPKAVQLLKLKWVGVYPRTEHSYYNVQLYLGTKPYEYNIQDRQKDKPYLFEIISSFKSGEYALIINNVWYPFRISN